jgi:hypothetical protein
MRVMERYSQAVNSDNLTVDERTTWSDTDVLGAAGFAGRHNPLGLALTRLFADGKAEAVLLELTQLAFKRSRTMRLKIGWGDADELSKAVLGWYRFGTCHPCGGTGYSLLKGAPVLGEECSHCGGTGRLPFDRLFAGPALELARWMSAEIDRAQAAAGSDAMRALAPKLEL